MATQHDDVRRPLVLFAWDLAARRAELGDETARELLISQIHESVLECWARDLERDWDGVLEHVRCDIHTCADLLSDVELRRILGQELLFLRKSQFKRPDKSPESFRREFLSVLEYGRDPLTDADSPGRRIAEMTEHLRTWADFPAFAFGVPDLDDAFGGVLPGDICVVAGAPGTMKTSLALSFLDDFIMRTEGRFALYCSVDMAPREIGMRLAERESGVPEQELRRLAAEGSSRYSEACGLVRSKYDGRLAVRGHTPGSRMTVRSMLDEALLRNAQLIIIDYLTRLKDPSQSDLEFVEEAMPMLLDHAHRYETSFLILSQIARASRSDQACGHLGGHSRGGGIVEELAHSEIELVRQETAGTAPMIIACVAKARRGRAGLCFSLDYEGPLKRFTGKSQRVVRKAPRLAKYVVNIA